MTHSAAVTHSAAFPYRGVYARAAVRVGGIYKQSKSRCVTAALPTSRPKLDATATHFAVHRGPARVAKAGRCKSAFSSLPKPFLRRAKSGSTITSSAIFMKHFSA